MMPDRIASHLIEAQTIVEKRYPEIHEKWVRLYTALANLGAVSILRHQGDMRFDLLLRGLEDEYAARFRAGIWGGRLAPARRSFSTGAPPRPDAA